MFRPLFAIKINADIQFLRSFLIVNIIISFSTYIPDKYMDDMQKLWYLLNINKGNSYIYGELSYEKQNNYYNKQRG